jgi:hypothetical protein
VEDDVSHRRQGDAEALHRARVRDINEVMSMGDWDYNTFPLSCCAVLILMLIEQVAEAAAAEVRQRRLRCDGCGGRTWGMAQNNMNWLRFTYVFLFFRSHDLPPQP